MKRNLAAVLAADVARYSRLMGEDADATLAALRRLRAELFGPLVAGHRGKLVKSMGDGWIVTFASAVRSGSANACLRLGRFDEVLVQADSALRRVPGYVAAYRPRMAALVQMGRLDEARETLAVLDRILAGVTLSSIRAGSNYVDTPATRPFFDGMRMAGMPE